MGEGPVYKVQAEFGNKSSVKVGKSAEVNENTVTTTEISLCQTVQYSIWSKYCCYIFVTVGVAVVPGSVVDTCVSDTEA